jgi:hypothetical protein
MHVLCSIHLVYVGAVIGLAVECCSREVSTFDPFRFCNQQAIRKCESQARSKQEASSKNKKKLTLPILIIVHHNYYSKGRKEKEETFFWKTMDGSNSATYEQVDTSQYDLFPVLINCY